MLPPGQQRAAASHWPAVLWLGPGRIADSLCPKPSPRCSINLQLAAYNRSLQHVSSASSTVLATGAVRKASWPTGVQLQPLAIGFGWPVVLTRGGRYLVRPCDLVWACGGRNGLFCRLPGRGGCLGGPTTKWGGQGGERGPRDTRRSGGAPGGAALTFAPGRAAGAVFLFRGVPSEISG
jgi:hypothetical protein